MALETSTIRTVEIVTTRLFTTYLIKPPISVKIYTKFSKVRAWGIRVGGYLYRSWVVRIDVMNIQTMGKRNRIANASTKINRILSRLWVCFIISSYPFWAVSGLKIRLSIPVKKRMIKAVR